MITVKNTCSFILLLSITIASISSTWADATIWRIQSNKPPDTIPYDLEQAFAVRVAELTDNQLVIKVQPPGGFVSIRSTFSAVRTSQIEGMFMNPQYWSAADPVFAILGDLITAWDTPQEYQDWLVNDNGIKYLQDSYSSFGLTLVDFTIAPLESLVANTPIRTIEDLKGKIIRTPPGMATDYFAHLGALTRQISFDKVNLALARKQISFADFSDVVMNDLVGLYKQAKHTNHPGFHSLSFVDFVVNSKAWDSLPPAHKRAVKLASEEWKNILSKIYNQQVEKTIMKLKDEGVKVYVWSDESRMQARKLAVPIWMKYAAKSPKANQVMQELLVKLKEIGNL